MVRTDRARLSAVFALYAALALAWAGFAAFVVPPRLAATRPGPLVEALKPFLHVPPAGFLRHDLPGRWRELSGALLIALMLHLSVVLRLARPVRREGARSSPRLDLILGIIAGAFLAVAAVAPTRQDYFFYLEIWYHVRQGHDPWFDVLTINGMAPLNAYGPLFNLLAGLAWINPVAPRLLLSYAYILFAVAMSRGFAAGRPPSATRTLALLVLFWSPFAWIELAYYGHLDILVALASLGAVRAWAEGRDIRAGLDLAAGVLLKYLPIVLLPLLASDRKGARPRFLGAALAAIAIGLGLSHQAWGLSTFSAPSLAAGRRPEGPSIFRFLDGRYSPILGLGYGRYLGPASIVAQLVGLWGVWRWSRSYRPDITATAAAAALVSVLFYRVGYPQYQMVPFVLTSAWMLRDWDRLAGRIAPAVAMSAYFGWLTAYDVGYAFHEARQAMPGWKPVEDAAGLPTLILGSALLACLIRAATPGRPLHTGPGSCSDV